MKMIDALTVPAILSYFRTYQGNSYLLESLFPNNHQNELTYEYIIGARRRPVAAKVTAWGAPATIAGRQGGTKKAGEILPIKRKIQIDEKTIIQLNMPRQGGNDVQEAIRKIYDDQTAMYEAVRTRIEVMRADALSTGKITLNEEGVVQEADFGVVNGQKQTLVGAATWDNAATADPIGDLRRWKQAIIDLDGDVPERILMSQKALGYAMDAESTRVLVYGDLGGSRVITRAQFDQVLRAYDLPPVATYDDKYYSEGANGVLTLTRFWPEDIVVLMPGGKLGDTLYAPTAEALKKVREGIITFGQANGIFGIVWEDDEPPAHWTKAAAVSFPTFPAADSIFIANVY